MSLPRHGEFQGCQLDCPVVNRLQSGCHVIDIISRSKLGNRTLSDYNRLPSLHRFFLLWIKIDDNRAQLEAVALPIGL